MTGGSACQKIGVAQRPGGARAPGRRGHDVVVPNLLAPAHPGLAAVQRALRTIPAEVDFS